MRSRSIVLLLGLAAVPVAAEAQQMRAGASVSAQASAQARGSGEGGGESGAAAAAASRADASSEARLAESRDALEVDGRGATTAEIEAGARALASGAQREDLERIRDQAPRGHSLTASLNALATLSARGVSSAHAAAVVSTHLSRGAGDAAITRLGATARTASALNTSLQPGSMSGLSGGLGTAGALGGSLGPSLGGAVGLTGSIGGRIRH